jgi:hypothetical protein
VIEFKNYSLDTKVAGCLKIQVDQKIGKNCPKLRKLATTIAKPTIAKISTSKLNLKVQNIYKKTLLKPKYTWNNPYFKTAYFR